MEFSPCPKIEKSEIHRGDTRNGGKGKKLTRNFQNVKNKRAPNRKQRLEANTFYYFFFEISKAVFQYPLPPNDSVWRKPTLTDGIFTVSQNTEKLALSNQKEIPPKMPRPILTPCLGPFLADQHPAVAMLLKGGEELHGSDFQCGHSGLHLECHWEMMR